MLSSIMKQWPLKLTSFVYWYTCANDNLENTSNAKKTKSLFMIINILLNIKKYFYIY